MRFFIATEPPTVTAQEKKVAVVKGRPIFYDPPAVKAAKQVLCKTQATQVSASPAQLF